jgi:hypothetical protein
VTILKTLLYADVFSFPLTLDELYRYLIGVSYQRAEILHALEHDPWLRERVVWEPPYAALAGRAKSTARRRRLTEANDHLLARATGYGVLLGATPFIRLVAVTGALAAANSSDAGDDIDLLLVTVPGRLWLARAMVIAVSHLARLRGVTLCPNYLMDLDVLQQSDRTLFTAQELAHLIPLYGENVLAALFEANRWAKDYLPNGFAPNERGGAVDIPAGLKTLKRWGEWVLSGALGARIESWEQRRKVAKLSRLAEQQNAERSCFTSQMCKGHIADHGARIEQLYRQRLREAGLLGPEQA